MNIVNNLELSAKFCPGKTALLFEDQAITYEDLLLKANQLASGMEAAGIEKGDRVGLFMPNLPEFLMIYFAAQKIGAIVVALNVLLVKNEVRYILKDCGAKMLFAGKDQVKEVPVDELPDLEQLVLVEGDPENEMHIEKLYDKTVRQFKTQDMNEDDPCAILYTSGTTGFPKGAVLTHFGVLTNINATIYHTGMKSDDVLHLFLPLFHCFGQNFIMNAGIKRGATLVMHRRFEPEPVIRAIARHGVTMFFAVPTIYIYLLNMKDEELNLKSIRYYFTAAAAMPLEVAEAWHARREMPIHDGYGLTECSPFGSYNHDFKHKPGSIGHPIINGEMKIVDESGNPVAPGKWGEICIKGPNVMKGYWNKPEETAKTIRNGWLHTGDVGTQDQDGDYFIVDRVKDMIISAGNNIYPTEIENHLYAHPDIHEVAVFGIPDSIKGEAVKAAIVLKPGKTPDPFEIIEFCKTRMAKYKVPKQVFFLDELPKSATGKILKRVLRETASRERQSA
ncbi:MAG: long-chain fatty acid--CoA ligase [Desulfobacterales bacterium RIFOXYA12_FULL_46_15]|nr:MAG: long-chain fatty acid--CoA ligase [Desulfobacterales bacterium RIFOXYA12_FULL_46_15]